jgi:hypothetical protein
VPIGSSSDGDCVRSLQRLALSVANYLSPGTPARRVVILGPGGEKLLDCLVPACPP